MITLSIAFLSFSMSTSALEYPSGCDTAAKKINYTQIKEIDFYSSLIPSAVAVVLMFAPIFKEICLL